MTHDTRTAAESADFALSHGDTASSFTDRIADRHVARAANRQAPARLLPRAFDAEHFPIIVHSHLRWDFVWQRPQQILSRLAREHHVLFIEEPKDGGDEPSLDISSPMGNIVRVVPMLPPAIGRDVDAQCQALLPVISSALRTHPLLAGAFDAPVQWFYSPATAPTFLGRFGAAAVVYDCMDELASFRGASSDLPARERFLLARADIVYTGGPRLFAAKSPLHGNVHMYGCGVDIEHYARAKAVDTKVPDELVGLSRPILGYFGVIDERIDYPLIDHIARNLPEASVVMIGPLAKVSRAALPGASNIHWLGQRSYDALPALVKAFDVCLMPFALNEATRYINPTKTLEYMAAGKPIVSTPVTDVVASFGDIVDIAGTPEAFVKAIGRAWPTPDATRITNGIERAGRASWDSTVTSMRNDLLRTVGALRA